MAQNQKKPTNLSMGGVFTGHSKPKMAKNPQADERRRLNYQDIAKRLPARPKINRENIIKGPKKKSSLKFLASAGRFIKDKLIFILVLSYIGALYLFKLDELPPESAGVSSLSAGGLAGIGSVDFLPLKVALVGLNKIGVNSVLEVRLLSVLILFFALFCFYKLVSAYAGKWISTMAVLLFASSAWLLFQTRQDSLQTLMFALIPATLYLGHLMIRSDSWWLKALCAVILAQFIFVPGGIWFLLSGFVVAWVYFKPQLVNKTVILPLGLIALSLIGYIGLIYYLALDYTSQLMRVLGFELGQLPDLATVRDNLLELPKQLFISGPDTVLLWLHQTPVIDWISSIFLLSGIIYLVKSDILPVKKRLVLLFASLSLLLIAINGASYISVLLPLVYLVVIIGIAYLARLWLLTFPSNPLARSFGIILISLTVVMACAYNVEKYFIAWPETNEYHQIFSE